MPQVHNKSVVLDTAAVGKNSRFGAASESSKIQRRRQQALTSVDRKLRDMRLSVDRRHMLIYVARLNSLQERYTNSLRRTLAYRDVIETKSFSKIADRKLRLNTNYSLYALRYDMALALEKRHPNYIRKKEAMERVDLQKERYERLMARNLRKIKSPNTRRKKELRRRMGFSDSDSEYTTESETDASDDEDDEAPKKSSRTDTNQAETAVVPGPQAPLGPKSSEKKPLVVSKDDMLRSRASKMKTEAKPEAGNDLPSSSVLPPITQNQFPSGTNSKPRLTPLMEDINDKQPLPPIA